MNTAYAPAYVNHATGGADCIELRMRRWSSHGATPDAWLVMISLLAAKEVSVMDIVTGI